MNTEERLAKQLTNRMQAEYHAEHICTPMGLKAVQMWAGNPQLTGPVPWAKPPVERQEFSDERLKLFAAARRLYNKDYE